jgi:hypothetical protein
VAPLSFPAAPRIAPAPAATDWCTCPDCDPEYWQHAYEKQMHYGISTSIINISRIGLKQEDDPKPEGYPSTFATIPRYQPMIQNQPRHYVGATADVMLLGLITKQESTIFDLEAKLDYAINRGALADDEQEIRIEKLENELNELKQFIMGSKTKKDTCVDECWLCGKIHPEEELC